MLLFVVELLDDGDLLPARAAEGGADDGQLCRPLVDEAAGSLDDLGGSWPSTSRRWPGSAQVVPRYRKEILRLLAEVTLGTGALAVIGGTVGVITFLAFFTGTEVGLQGYSALNQIGTSAFTGFVSAYFNTREIAPAGRRHRAGRDGRLRLHRPARRDADQRGDRRARGHGDPVAAVPGHHPDHRRPHRGRPAVRRRPALVVLRHQAHVDHVLRAEQRARTTTTSTCSCHPATCSGRSARCWSSPSGDPDPLLLRLLRHRRSGRRRRGRRPRGPDVDRRDQRRRPAARRWRSGARRPPSDWRGRHHDRTQCSSAPVAQGARRRLHRRAAASCSG